MMSGFELSKRVQSRRPEIKILYMSGSTENMNELMSILKEGKNYIQKPFTIESLARTVRDVLDA
jgi:two-component system, cell cycle sensor histidine kinase and response regulator CckA